MPAAPHYYALVALAEAWPFCAPEGFEAAPLRLARASSTTAKLAAGFEDHARVLARGHSLATLAAIRDRAWFDGSSNDRLEHKLIALAARHLRWEGDTVRLAPCAPDSRHEQTMRWRGLSLRLPQDLLIAALAARARVEPCSDRVRLVGHALAPTLERPVAETHLHMGAALDFGDLWIAVLEGATRPHFCEQLSAGPAPFVDPTRYNRVLVAAALVRQLLVSFLWHIEVLGAQFCEGFAAFVREWLPRIAARTGASARATNIERACLSALAELRTGLGHDAGSSLAQMIRAHHLLWGRRAKIASLGALHASDPVARWLPPAPGRARPETRFIYRGLAHLCAAPEPTPQLARTLWQYLRVRNLVFGHLVEAPGAAGLGWFTRHYDRLRAHRGQLRDRVVESALCLGSSGINLASLEVRTAPPRRWHQVRATSRSVARQAREFKPGVGLAQPEIGLVLHFIKHDMAPGRFFTRCRYGRWFFDNWARAGAIARALRLDPKLLLVLRGLDVAAHELAVPTWALLPLFERVREASRAASGWLAHARPRWKVPPLRTTLHAGEEFHRLVEGLRRIHEAIDFGLLREGDRVGHGLALGWSTRAWIEHNPISVQPREERLFDLIWEFERYGRRELPAERGRLAYVSAQLHDLSREIFERPISEHALIDLRRRLFDRGTMREQLDFPFGRRLPTATNDAVGDLIARYLVDPGVHRRAVTPIEVRADEQERVVLEQAQRWLRGQLARLGVTVEANPSSNLLIGDFSDLREHPTFRLSPIEGDDSQHEHRLPVSINSDDPLTFASCLADEYAYMEAALIGRRVSARSTLAWLDEAREAGWSSRFTLPASRESDCLSQVIDGARGRSRRDAPKLAGSRARPGRGARQGSVYPRGT